MTPPASATRAAAGLPQRQGAGGGGRPAHAARGVSPRRAPRRIPGSRAAPSPRPGARSSWAAALCLSSCLSVCFLLAASPALAQDSPLTRFQDALRREALAGELEAALASYRSLGESEDTPLGLRVRALLRAAACETQLGRDKQADVLAARALRLSADVPRLHALAEQARATLRLGAERALALRLDASGSHAAAQQLYDRLLERRTADATLWLLRGVSRYAGGEPKRALADLSEALEREPGLVDARLWRAAIAREAGQEGLAAGDLAAAVEGSGSRPEAYLERGRWHLERQRSGAAERDLRQALRRDPEGGAARLELGRALLAQLALDEARRELSAVAERRDRPRLAAEALVELSWLERGEADPALALLSAEERRRSQGRPLVRAALEREARASSEAALQQAEAHLRQALRLAPEAIEPALALLDLQVAQASPAERSALGRRLEALLTRVEGLRRIELGEPLAEGSGWPLRAARPRPLSAWRVEIERLGAALPGAEGAALERLAQLDPGHPLVRSEAAARAEGSERARLASLARAAARAPGRACGRWLVRARRAAARARRLRQPLGQRAALWGFARAWLACPGHGEALLAAAQLCADLGRPAAAEQLSQRACAARVWTSAAWAWRGRLLGQLLPQRPASGPARDPGAALSCFERALSLAPITSGALQAPTLDALRGRARLRLSRAPDEARDDLRQLREALPAEPSELAELSPAALASARAGLSLLEEVERRRGAAPAELERTAATQARLRAAIAARLGRDLAAGEELERDLDLAGAIEAYERALVLDPDRLEAIRGRGRSHLRGGDLLLGALDLSRAAQLDPSQGPALLARLETLANVFDLAPLVRGAEELAKSAPRRARAHLLRGLLTLTRSERGRVSPAELRGALRGFDRALELDPGFALAYLGRGRLQELQAREDPGAAARLLPLAERDYAAAEERYPRGWLAPARQAALLAGAQRAQAALEQLRRAVERGLDLEAWLGRERSLSGLPPAELDALRRAPRR